MHSSSDVGPILSGMAGEEFEVHEDEFLVDALGRHYRVSPPRIQMCPNCDHPVRERRPDDWRCEHCGYREDNRPLIGKHGLTRRTK